MSRRFLTAVVAVALLLGAATLGYAAAVKQYQYTGAVTEVTADSISVDKGGEIWQFGLGGMKAAVKKGDKVTVYYTMTATKIEAKK